MAFDPFASTLEDAEHADLRRELLDLANSRRLLMVAMGYTAGELMLFTHICSRFLSDTFEGFHVVSMLRNLAWSAARPIANPAAIAGYPHMHQHDPQLFSWRYWHQYRRHIQRLLANRNLPEVPLIACFHCSSRTTDGFRCGACHRVPLCPHCHYLGICSRCGVADGIYPFPQPHPPIASVCDPAYARLQLSCQ